MNAAFLNFFTGLTIGLIGAFHCIGMCGPLALALPLQGFNNIQKNTSIFLYNIGRATTYTLIGIAFGCLGKSFSIFKLQQLLSIIAGITLIIILLGYNLNKYAPTFIKHYTEKIKFKLSFYLQSKKTISSYYLIGIINGMLPCGLVYVAILPGMATGSVLQSGILMLGFGLGTFPLMAFTMFFGQFISFSFRKNIQKATPFIIGILGILLIVRGLNLNIPYISPSLHQKTIISCH